MDRLQLVGTLILLAGMQFAVNVGATSTQSDLLFQKTWGVGSYGGATGEALGVDSSDNIYVTGDGGGGVFLSKFDSTGTMIWQRTWTPNINSTNYTKGIAVDSSGNTYVTGSTSSSPYPVDNDIFLLKFNASGSLVWQRTYGTNSNDEGFSVAVDASGNAYVTGGIAFGKGSWDVLLLKVDSSGNLVWQKTWGDIHSDYGKDVAIDTSGNIYVTGTTDSFGNDLSEILLLKFDSSGNLIWQKTWGPRRGLGLAYGNAVAVNSSGDIYVAGDYDALGANDLFLLKLDSSGSLVWQRTWDSGDWDYPQDVAVDSSGGIYVGGFVMGYNVLLLRFDSSGNHFGQVTWGNHNPGESEHGYGVVVDSSGNPVMTGFVSYPPFTLEYPNGTVSAPSIGLGVPNVTLDTPTFSLNTPTGIVQAPSVSESPTRGGAFLVKFTPLSYTQEYKESPLGAFALIPIEFYGILSSTIVLIGAFTTTLLRQRRQTVTTQPTTPPTHTEKTTAGFIISLTAATFIILGGLILLWQSEIWFPNSITRTIGAVGVICGEIVVIGALLIRTMRKRAVGGILVIVFSIISTFGLGGYFIGLILGVIGGALSLAKPNRTQAAVGFALALVAGFLSIFLGAGMINEALHPPGPWAISILGSSVPAWFSRVNLGTLGWIEVASGIIVTIGALLIFMPRTKTVGSILAITFSIIGAIMIGSLSIMFAPLGIIAGAVGLLKTQTSKQQNP